MPDDGYMTFDDGRVSLGGVDLPGLMKSLVIRGQVRFDTADPDGASGTVRTPLGWEDSDAVLVMDVLGDPQMAPYPDSGRDVFEILKLYNDIFKGSDNGANPQVYTALNPHFQARGIDRVVWSGFQSVQNDEEDVLELHLNFVEHMPFETKKEARVAASDKAYVNDPAPAVADPDPDPVIMVGVK